MFSDKRDGVDGLPKYNLVLFPIYRDTYMFVDYLPLTVLLRSKGWSTIGVNIPEFFWPFFPIEYVQAKLRRCNFPVICITDDAS